MKHSHVLSYQLCVGVADRSYGAGTSKQADHSSKQTARTNVPPMQAIPASTQDLPSALQDITHHELHFNARSVLGIGHNGEVIVSEIDSAHLYIITHDGSDYIQKYEKNLPCPVNCKAIDGDRIFLQKTRNADTVCYDQELQELCTFQQEGLLFDCIDDELFYSQGTPGRIDWKNIVVCQIDEMPSLQLKKKMTLQPPTNHFWEITPSVCRAMGSYVVVESQTRSLDIFDANGMICVI